MNRKNVSGIMLAILLIVVLTLVTLEFDAAAGEYVYPFKDIFEKDLSDIASSVPQIEQIYVVTYFDFIRTVLIRINYTSGLSDNEKIEIQYYVQHQLKEKWYINLVALNHIFTPPEQTPPWPGFVIGELLVEFTEPIAAKISFSPGIPWTNESTLFNASASYSQNGNITRYEWDFGDGNRKITEIPTIDHTYSIEGDYNVTLNVTDNTGLWNSTTMTLTVTFVTDLNKDRKVDILDITIVAAVYGSHGPNIPNPGDPPSKNWNPTADLDKNNLINIIDITMVAKDYGKTV
jgi:hypothetical protein